MEDAGDGRKKRNRSLKRRTFAEEKGQEDVGGQDGAEPSEGSLDPSAIRMLQKQRTKHHVRVECVDWLFLTFFLACSGKWSCFYDWNEFNVQGVDAQTLARHRGNQIMNDVDAMNDDSAVPSKQPEYSSFQTTFSKEHLAEGQEKKDGDMYVWWFFVCVWAFSVNKTRNCNQHNTYIFSISLQGSLCGARARSKIGEICDRQR